MWQPLCELMFVSILYVMLFYSLLIFFTAIFTMAAATQSLSSKQTSLFTDVSSSTNSFALQVYKVNIF